MFLQTILLASLSLNVVLCEPPAPQYGVPFNNGDGYNNGGYNGNAGNGVNGNVHLNGNNYGGSNNYDGNNDHHGYGEPKAYEFGYQVKDDYTGTNYNRQEQSDGNQVTGSYRVALPDGRTQIVTYYADWKTGFHADVRYEGEAQYPDQYNTGNNRYGNNNGYANNNNGYANNNNYNNNGYANNNYNNNNNYNAPSQQYGPVNPIAINNQYAPAPSQNYGAPNSAQSSVSIKDYSGQGTAYNAGNNYDSGYNNNYDTYANSGFGNRAKPSNAYGAP